MWSFSILRYINGQGGRIYVKDHKIEGIISSVSIACCVEIAAPPFNCLDGNLDPAKWLEPFSSRAYRTIYKKQDPPAPNPFSLSWLTTFLSP